MLPAGIYSAGRLTVTDCTFLDNAAESSGGAIRNFGTFVMANCVLSENTARDGGALRSSGSTTLTGSVFTRNQAGYSGGGVSAGGTLNVENCVFVGNIAHDVGGAFWGLGNVTLTNSTLAGNSADNRGGGICTFSIETSVVLNNTIVAANTAPVAPDCSDEGNILSGSHSLIGDGTGQSGLVDGENGNRVGTEETPIDPRFVRAPSDGGDGWGDDPDTADVDESLNDDYGDLHLSSYSSAVDAGDNGLLPADVFDLDGDGDIEEPIPVDLAGSTRIQDGDADGMATVNMGAYESVAGGPPIPGDLNGDRLVDSGDLGLVRVYWGQTVSLGDLGSGDASGDGKVGAADLDIVRANWGAGAPAAASEGQLQIETRTRTNVYGPLRKAEVVPARERDAVFANAREIAEVLWAEAVEELRSRENRREAVAVDWVLSGWEGEEG